MKPKTLVPLLGVLVVLGVLVMLKQGQNQPVSITEQVKLIELLPADLKSDDIGTLEIFAGGTPDDKLLLTRTEDGERWEVSSHFNAPVKESEIADYLDALVGLKGEFRASAPSEEDLADYDLTENAGFHVIGRKSNSEDELFHVLVGKSPNYGNSFMRPQGVNDVFIANVNLRQEAGLYSENLEDPPTASSWLDKKIAGVDKDGVDRVELKTPDKTIVFEWRATEAAETPAEGEGEPEVPSGPEYEWVVAEGGVDGEFKVTGLNAILTKLANLSGTDIVDPSKKDQWHLDPAGYSCTVRIDNEEGEDEIIVIEGGRAPSDSDGYLRVASSENDVVYKINRYGFEQIFAKTSTLFTLPALSLSGADISEIAYTFDDHSVRLVKENEEWTVAEPASDLAIVASKPTSIAAALASWRAEDYADDMARTGLSDPSRSISFKTVSGEEHALNVGDPSTSIDGSYVQLDGGNQALTMTAIDVKKLFVEPKDLYDRSLFDIFEDDINRIEIVPGREGDAYTLERGDDGWILTVGDGPVELKEGVADELALAIADLQAADLDFSTTRTKTELVGAVSFTLADGTEYHLEAEAEADGQNPVTVSGIGTTFLVATTNIENAMPTLEELRAPEPEEPAEENVSETEGNDAADAESVTQDN